MDRVEYNIQRVNKLNVILIWIFSFVLTLQAFIADGAKRGILVLITTLITSIAVSLIVFLKVKDKIASVLVPLCPSIMVTILAVYEKGSPKIFIIYLVLLCVATLYFNRKTLLIFGIIQDLLFVIPTLIFNRKIISGIFPAKEVIVQFAMINVSILVLYFIAKWGNEYVVASYNKAEELNKALSLVSTIAVKLNKDIANFTEYINQVHRSSNSIITGMNQITKGAEEEAFAIGKISNMMTESQEKLQDTYEQSKSIEIISNDVQILVNENGKDILDMKDNMTVISSAVTEALRNVNDLSKKMNDINVFVSNISSIAQQTKLLSLNAAIEASKAGEAGRGFSVVAEEIRKLSDESNRIAEEIAYTISQIQSSAYDVNKIVQKGNEAVSEGSKVVDKLDKSIKRMIEAFGEMANNIQVEFESMNVITVLFKNIEEQLVSNAAIMEEHSTTTEEINSTINELNQRIEEISNIIKNIKELSDHMMEYSQKGVLDIL